jgi:SAM-dependent methyltransferase
VTLDNQRPLWKRFASRARASAYRLSTPIDRVLRRNHTGLLPPAHLRIYYYGTWDPALLEHASANARVELLSRGLQPHHRVLDIGSGIGALPLGLLDYLRGGYDGIEIHTEAVAWCQQAITRRAPTFRFHRANVVSRAYNPAGRVSASEYRFPFPDRSFDFIVLMSVFTHMMPEAVAHYLREIARVLAPGGTCMASYFLINDETRKGIDAGRSFMSFPVAHLSGVCRLHDATVPESAVAFDETFVHRIHEQAGLSIHEIRRGRWWNGERHDQDVLTVGRRET